MSCDGSSTCPGCFQGRNTHCNNVRVVDLFGDHLRGRPSGRFLWSCVNRGICVNAAALCRHAALFKVDNLDQRPKQRADSVPIGLPGLLLPSFLTELSYKSCSTKVCVYLGLIIVLISVHPLKIRLGSLKVIFFLPCTSGC